MEAVDTNVCNTLLESEGGLERGFASLPVMIHREHKEIVITSFWRPSLEEIEALKNGSLIMISILDDKMPPLRMEVSKQAATN